MQRLIEVRIEKLSLGGSGIARHEGQVIFVPFSAPGDLLRVEISTQKKNFSEATIVEVLEASPHRVTPPCSAFGSCGGCNWQHVSYSEQLNQKQKIVEEQLSKFLKSSVAVLPIVPSPQPLFYRNRIQVKRQGHHLGFFARESHDIVDINKCFIAEEALNEKLQKIRATPPPTDLQSIPLGSKESGFSQVNTAQNSNLIKTVLDWASSDRYPEIFDLYAGAGNFSFPLFEKFNRSPLTAVELGQGSCNEAQRKLRDLNFSPKKFRFVMSDVEHFLKRHTIAPSGLILLDPPRVGCTEDVVRSLAHQPFQKILYISCNPSTLGRDLARLLDLSPRRLSLNRVQPFDMFPQTDHVEVLAELVVVDS